MFQLSKLTSLLLKAARLAVGGAEWDALVAGSKLQAAYLLTNICNLPCSNCVSSLALIAWQRLQMIGMDHELAYTRLGMKGMHHDIQHPCN